MRHADRTGTDRGSNGAMYPASPNPGTSVRDRAGIIIVSESETPFHNVWHRGSRICLDQEGRKKRLVPSGPTAWTCFATCRKFDLSPASLSPGVADLHQPVYGASRTFPCTGSRFCRTAGAGQGKNSEYQELSHGANWLVMENFYECYHCPSSHPEYSAVHDRLKILARGAGKGTGPEAAESEFAPVFDRGKRKRPDG